MFASVNLPLHRTVQTFSSGTGSPGWSRKKGRETVVMVFFHLVQNRTFGTMSYVLDTPQHRQITVESESSVYLVIVALSGCQLPGLFDGCSFYFHGEFRQPTPPREDLVRLVTLGGGSVLHREPTVDMVNQSAVSVPYHAHVTSSLANCSHYVVSADERDVTAVAGDRLCRVPPSWIMTCIAQFQLVDKLSS